MFARAARRIPYLTAAIEDCAFDLWHGVSTRGDMSVWCRNFRKMQRWSFESGYRPETFIDLGSGSGKACLMASLSGRYRKVVGIEIDTRHLTSPCYRDGIQCISADAATFDLRPYTAPFVFMFNPFGADVLRWFLERNAGLRLQVGYSNDIWRSELERAGFVCIQRDAERKVSLWWADI